MASTSTPTETVRERRARTRRRWWFLAIGVIVGYSLLTAKPTRYRDEAAVMEEIAGVLQSPVAYERIEGWSWAPYVTHVYLPRVELDEGRTRELVRLLRRLPKLRDVAAYYIRDQEESVEQLRREIAPLGVAESMWVSTEDKESRQKRTFVAGIHR